MATVPVLTFHDGKLDVPEDLQRDWKLSEGMQLRVLSTSSSSIVLETLGADRQSSENTVALWESLRGTPPDDLTAEWDEAARLRKQQARERLDLLYGSAAGTSELRAAEREWERADDELDFGPFRTT